jgi:hypothetical protein
MVTIALWVGPRFALAAGEEVGAGEAVALFDGGTEGAGGAARQALTEAKAALGANPPNRDAARAAFERATQADDDSTAVAEAYFRLGALEEEDRAFVRAIADQRACMAKGPTSSFARSARLRIGWMSARSEGDFAPLARLQRVRRDPALLNDPVAIQSLAADAEAFPPGRVRAEARMFVAGAWLNRMNRRKDALAELRKVVDDPSSDSQDASIAHRHLVETFLADGQIDAADREVQAHPIDVKLGAQVRRLLRRRTLRRGALVELVAFFCLAIAGMAFVRSRRGGTSWQRARTALHGFASVALAAGLALLCCVSVAAVAFVWLDVTNAKYLESIGL